MKENLLRTIEAYIDDAFNDGVGTGRETYQKDAIRSLTNMSYDLLQAGKPNQAEAIHEAIKRMEQLD